MRSHSRPRTLKLGSIVFLFLALALAVASGDVLLVLAVGSAVAGIVLLTMRRAPAPDARRAAVPIEDRLTGVERTAMARPRRATGRMAVRRYRSAALFSKRIASSSARAAAADANVAEAPGQAQAVQVLQ